MDLTQLSTADLEAIQSGDMSKVSTAGLQAIAQPPAQPTQQDSGILDTAARYAKMLTPAGVLSSLFTDQGRQDLKNNIAGGVRGAGSIGATLMYPLDKATDMVQGDRGPSLSGLITGQQPVSRNEERRQAMTSALQSMGVDTSSGMFQLGKLGAEAGGTAGIGSGTAAVLSKVPGVAKVAGPLLNAIETGGFTTGGSGAADLGIRALGGGINGFLTAGAVNPEDAVTGGALGAGLPVAAKAVGAATQAAAHALRGNGVSPEIAALAQRAQQLGIDIPADRLANSKPMDALASALNYVPFSGRTATEAKMGDQLNQALSKTFGQNTSNVTQALRQAEGSLGGQFDQFLKNNTVQMTPQFLQDLADSSNMATRELGPEQAKVIHNQIDEIINKASTGQIDGQAAYNIKKTLDRIGNRNSPEAWYALDLKGKLMNALNDSVGPQQAQTFGQLRQQYGNMLALQKIAKNGAEGDISVARLANMKNINNDDLQELADIAAQFVKPREGQHGAMQRAVAGAALFGTGGAPGLVGGGLLGRATNMALNSNAARQAVLNGRAQLPGLLSSSDLGLIASKVVPLLATDQ